MSIKNTPLAALLVALFLFVLSSCKSDTPVEGTDTSTDISGIDFKRTENIVSVRLPDEPNYLSPVITTQAYARYVHEYIFQTLNHMDLQTFELTPMLAGLPEVSEQEDGTILHRYQLDERATWPNGSPVTTADVVFSLKLLLNPKVEAGAVRSFYQDVTDMIIEDERSFSIQTGQVYILTDYALASLYVYPEYAYDPEGLLSEFTVAELANAENAAQLAENDDRLETFAQAFQDFEMTHNPDNIVGSGAYKLDSWEPQQRLILSKRDDYWAEGSDNPALKALPDGMEFEIIPDAQTAVVALQDELVDVVVDMDPERFVSLRQDEAMVEKFSFSTEPGFGMYSIIINSDDPMLSDAGTRRALAHLMDVDLLNEEYYNGMGKRSSNPVLPAQTYYDESLALIDFNVEEAERLLAEAGWIDSDGDGTLDRDGQDFELEFLTFSTPIGEAISQLLREGCQQVGINVTTEAMGGRALYGKLNEGDFQSATYAQGYQPHPDEFSQSWLTTSVPPGGTNRGRFGDEESDALINKIRVTTDAEERAELYKQMQGIFYRETPQIPLFSPLMRIVVSKRFEVETGSITPGFSLDNFVHLQE